MDDILRQIHRHTEAPTYRVWKQAWMNETQRYVYNVYIVEPSGQALQLNGFIEHADDDSVPRWNASLCGQGTCSRTMLEDHEGFSPDAAGSRGSPAGLPAAARLLSAAARAPTPRGR